MRYLLLTLALLASCGGDGPNRATAPEGRVIHGTLSAPECAGGYEIDGATVELRDEKDELIGATTTGSDNTVGGRCEVEFTLEQVPKAKFYSITVGSHDGPSYSFSEMEGLGWKLDLNLD